MSKFGLSKKELFREVKALSKHAGGESKTLGTIVHGFVRYGGHAGLAVWSTTMERGWFGIDLIRPDTITAALSGFAWVIAKIRKKKGEWTKAPASTGAAGGHAFITRLVLKGRTLMVHGPDGTWTFKQG